MIQNKLINKIKVFIKIIFIIFVIKVWMWHFFDKNIFVKILIERISKNIIEVAITNNQFKSYNYFIFTFKTNFMYLYSILNILIIYLQLFTYLTKLVKIQVLNYYN